jgi:hypothetical protein
VRDDEDIKHEDPERPKGRMLLYWGCGASVRAGQPRVLDMATAAPADFGKFFVARSATQRGAHSAVGRPSWPNPDDSQDGAGNGFAAGRARVFRQGHSGRHSVSASRRPRT